MEEAAAKKVAIPTISAETEILCARLAKLAPGEDVSYEEMSKLIGGDVQGSMHFALRSARRKASREHNVVTVTVRGVGLRRAQGLDYTGIVTSAQTRMHRQGKRALGESLRMPKEEYQALSPEEQKTLNLKRSAVGLVVYATSAKAEKKLGESQQVQNSRLAVGDVLRLMQETKPK